MVEEIQENQNENANQTEEIKEVEVPEVTAEGEVLPFPRARVVNIMRSEIRGKILRSEVKEAMNLWLGDMLKKLAREMGNTQYGSVGIADFQRAVKPYDMIEDIVKDEQRLLLTVDKLKADSDHILREMQHFFTTLKGKRQEENKPI